MILGGVRRRIEMSSMRQVAAVTVALLVGIQGLAEARRLPAPRPVASKPPFQSAVLMDAGSGKVLFEKNPHLQWPPASMAKMMLMLIVAERVRDGEMHWNDEIRTSRWASEMGGSQVYLREGEQFTLAEMMQAVIIHSANDATVAVAEAVAGSSDAFVDLMNQRAKQLGLKDTVFYSPHGLPPAKGQKPDLSSAYDLAVLARQLVKFPQIMKWAGTRETTFRNGTFKLVNTNRLVRDTNWVDGLKTGYYAQAGFNVAATGQRHGLRLIAVVLGAPKKKECFDEAAKLLTGGFAQYKQVVAVRKGDVVASDVPVEAGEPHFVRVLAGSDLKMLVERSEKPNFTIELMLSKGLQAPLKASTTVGEVVVKADGQEVGKVPAVAGNAVQRQTSLWERWF